VKNRAKILWPSASVEHVYKNYTNIHKYTYLLQNNIVGEGTSIPPVPIFNTSTKGR
jgi:hypothetical protein